MTAWPALYAGEDVTIRIPGVRDVDSDSALDLSLAESIEFEMRRRLRQPGEVDDDEGNPIILEKDLTGDVDVDGSDILIDFTSLELGELAGSYQADCWVTIAGKRRLVQRGVLTILPTVNAP